MRIIGVELRLQYQTARLGSQQQEICLLPCNLVIELDEAKVGQVWDTRLNGTLHTDVGDFAIDFPQGNPQPYQYFQGNRGLTVDKK